VLALADQLTTLDGETLGRRALTAGAVRINWPTDEQFNKDERVIRLVHPHARQLARAGARVLAPFRERAHEARLRGATQQPTPARPSVGAYLSVPLVMVGCGPFCPSAAPCGALPLCGPPRGPAEEKVGFSKWFFS